MQNRELHDALHTFALDAAALLVEDQRSGAELGFEVVEERGRRSAVLYNYRPLVQDFLAERWDRLRALPSAMPAILVLGAGAAAYLEAGATPRVDAEPALLALLERLYGEATSFEFPEERFERIYAEVEQALYRESAGATVLAPVHGLCLESVRVELGEGLVLERGDVADAPSEALRRDLHASQAGAGLASTVFCVLEREVALDAPLPVAEARERFGELEAALRLGGPGRVAIGPLGWTRVADGRWQPLSLGAGGADDAAGGREPRTLYSDEGPELAELLRAVAGRDADGALGCAFDRFMMGAARDARRHALSDYLLALRALLGADGTSLAARFAALCAEEPEREELTRRVRLALALERTVMAGGDARECVESAGLDSPGRIVAEVESHLRALLRDVLCGYLQMPLAAVADEILLRGSAPVEITARDLREEPPPPEPEPGPVPVPDPEPEPDEIPEPDEFPRPGEEPVPEEEPDLEPVAELAPVPGPVRVSEFLPGEEPDFEPDHEQDLEPEYEAHGFSASSGHELDEDAESYAAPA